LADEVEYPVEDEPVTKAAPPVSNKSRSTTKQAPAPSKPVSTVTATLIDKGTDSANGKDATTEAEKLKAHAEQFGTNTTVDEDEDLARRKARAERFGIPLVEPQKDAPGPTKGRRRQPKAAAVPEDLEKLKARAEKFGTGKNPNATQAEGRKRKSIAGANEEVDAEEVERRRKRAERFGLPVKV